MRLFGPPKWLLSAFAHSGDSAVVLPVLGLAWWRAGFGIQGTAAIASIAVLGTMALTAIAKLVFRRPRPEGNWGSIYRRLDPHSFPSGHAARTLALAIVILAKAGIVPGFILISWSIAVGFSRVSLGVHWLLDVAVGWALGLAAGLLVVGFIT